MSPKKIGYLQPPFPVPRRPEGTPAGPVYSWDVVLDGPIRVD